MPSRRNAVFALSTAILLLAQPLLAFQSPLSDISIREAYFLGQRQDEKFSITLDKYTQHLASPKTGPYIESVSFLTPFAQVLRFSHDRSFGYSAQQAQLDFLSKPESVFVTVRIFFTASYSSLLPQPPNSRRDAPATYAVRPSDFWRDFHVATFGDGKEPLSTLSNHGEPTYRCDEGGCVLTGAFLRLEFPAEAFTSDTATIQIDPPEGATVSVDFDLSLLR
jgi:hypothetical protein